MNVCGRKNPLKKTGAVAAWEHAFLVGILIHIPLSSFSCQRIDKLSFYILLMDGARGLASDSINKAIRIYNIQGLGHSWEIISATYPGDYLCALGDEPVYLDRCPES